ncbi:hypothetical protein HanRHA438_Chr04g0179751 [Helianthus annuus]|nr:hypothetical protein HanRHA438_Chr04g0179751 [Helianthus annuus]
MTLKEDGVNTFCVRWVFLFYVKDGVEHFDGFFSSFFIFYDSTFRWGVFMISLI